MHQLKRGPNVVVSFHIPELQHFDVEYAKLPSRAELVRMTLNPFAQKRLPNAPGLTTVLMRSLMANRQDFNRQLKPGDLVTTGTPPGVGMGIRPEPVFLREGDVMELSIDRLGVQRQTLIPFAR